MTISKEAIEAASIVTAIEQTITLIERGSINAKLISALLAECKSVLSTLPISVDLPWRTKDLMRGLILFRTSNNAHGYTNVSILSERVDSLPQVAKDELANMMRNIAAELSLTGEDAAALYQVELEDGTIDHISGVFGMPVQINGIPVSKVTPLYARPQPASTALVERLTKALSAVSTWAEQRCPCRNEEPNPCPLCGADANKPGDICLSAENTFPRDLLTLIRDALSKEVR